MAIRDDDSQFKLAHDSVPEREIVERADETAECAARSIRCGRDIAGCVGDRHARCGA